MRKPRAIIFDDDVLILDMFREFLSQRGYEVFTYGEPIVCPIYEKSSDTCTEENPCADVILTDFEMPRMNGVELLQAQSKRECKLNIKNKAVISGNISNEDKEAIEKFGCLFFSKPLDLKKLSDWLLTCEKRIDLSQPLATLQDRQGA